VYEQDGYSLSASQVQDLAQPGLFYDARDGWRLVATEITVGNTDGERITVNALNAVLRDANGFLYTPELGAVNGQIELMDISKGEKVKGFVGFMVPDDAQLEAVKFQVSPSIVLIVGLNQ
jgi:hypothetical protein